jgi:quercetin dioxygenase-like cupin family protein
VVPVDLKDVRFLVVSTVEPGTEVSSHSHDEAILRYITSGSLTLNGEEFGAGDWILVPRDAPDEILTAEGYTAVAGYGQACK